VIPAGALTCQRPAAPAETVCADGDTLQPGPAPGLPAKKLHDACPVSCPGENHELMNVVHVARDVPSCTCSVPADAGAALASATNEPTTAARLTNPRAGRQPGLTALRTCPGC
jgi:hypothetical protein